MGVKNMWDEIHLLNIAVSPQMQRNGYARLMLSRLIDYARQHESQKILLEVRSSNTSAQSLYAGYGFEQIGLRKAYYPAIGGREDAVVMALDCQ